MLTALIAIPALGALLLAFLPKGKDELAKLTALGVTLVVAVLTVVMAIRFDNGGPRFQFTEQHWWIRQFHVHYAVGVDGVALVLILLSAILVPLVVLASWHDADRSGGVDEPPKRSVKTYFALLLALEAMMIGVFAATDIFLFYVFFEAMLIPMYFIIGSYGGPQRSYAAVKFLLYSLFGGLLMLVAVIALYVQGPGTFLFTELAKLNLDPTAAKWLFLGFFIAFAIKAPLVPFHTWLPDAAGQAPAGAAVLIVGVLAKVGTYGMLRFCLELFPGAAKWATPVVITLAVIGIIYGAVLAIGQVDLKRLIAYTSISHFGFIILGIFVMTSQGQSGATLYMVNHGFSTAALFLVAGFMISRRGTRLINAYGGVQKVAPVLAGTFLVAGLATLSLPGLAPFISEFLVLIGTFTRYPVFAVFAATALVLSAVYILWMYQRMMTGPVAVDNEKLRDLVPREILVVAPLIALLLVLGVYPKPALDVINPAVSHTLTTINQPDPAAKIAEGPSR